MTNYATEPLETLNIDLNAAVFGVNSLSGYAKVDDLSAYASQTDLGDIDAVLDAVGGTDDFKIQLIERTITSVSANDFAKMTSIGKGAFYGCSALKSVVIPNTITSISEYAFYGCDNLSSVEIPSTIATIESYSFGNCYSLRTVTIPNGITTIKNHAFVTGRGSNCTFYVPDSVTSIGWQSSFGGNYVTGDTRIIDFGTTRTTIPEVINYSQWTPIFYLSNANNKIYVPAALLDDWKAASGWADAASHIEAHP